MSLSETHSRHISQQLLQSPMEERNDNFFKLLKLSKLCRPFHLEIIQYRPLYNFANTLFLTVLQLIIKQNLRNGALDSLQHSKDTGISSKELTKPEPQFPYPDIIGASQHSICDRLSKQVDTHLLFYMKETSYI